MRRQTFSNSPEKPDNEQMTNNPRIVLTGGPCGGKTSLLRELREADPYGERWLFVPEAAPLLFQSG